MQGSLLGIMVWVKGFFFVSPPPLFLKAGSPMVQTDFKLIVKLRITLDFLSSCLFLPCPTSAGIRGLCHHTWFIWCWESKSGFPSWQAGIQPTEWQPQPRDSLRFSPLWFKWPGKVSGEVGDRQEGWAPFWYRGIWYPTDYMHFWRLVHLAVHGLNQTFLSICFVIGLTVWSQWELNHNSSTGTYTWLSRHLGSMDKSP